MTRTLIALAVLLVVVSFAVSADPAPAGALAPGEVRRFSLGNGQHAAIAAAVPAGTYIIGADIDANACNIAGCDNSCASGTLVVASKPVGASVAYLGFDLWALGEDVTVTKATLDVAQSAASGADPVTLTLSKLREGWSCPMAWGAQPDLFTVYDTQSVSAEIELKSWDVTGLVQDWAGHDFGQAPNFGLRLSGPTGLMRLFERVFLSRETGESSPRLHITYQAPTPSPTATYTPTPTPTRPAAGRVIYLPLIMRAAGPAED